MKRSTFYVGHEEWRPSEGAPGTRLVGALTAVPALIREFGVDPDSVLREAGLSSETLADPSGRIAWESAVRLVRMAATRTDCPHFGLLAGRKWGLSDLGLLGELVRHSPTVVSALHELIVNHHLNSEGALFFLGQQDDVVDLGFAAYVPFAEPINRFYDGVLAAIMNFMRELCGNGWNRELGLLCALSADRCQAVLRVLPGAAALRTRRSTLPGSPRNGSRDPSRGRNQSVSSPRASRQTPPTEECSPTRFTERCGRYLLCGNASGTDISQALAIHRRTLNRRLNAEGTTFQQVLDGVRFAVAKELLENSELTLPEIGFALGYANSAAFIPAFRRWTGTTPGAWRRSSRNACDPAAVSTPRMPCQSHGRD